MTHLTMIATIDGVPVEFQYDRKIGESKAVAVAHCMSKVIAYVDGGHYEEMESVEWDWT